MSEIAQRAEAAESGTAVLLYSSPVAVNYFLGTPGRVPRAAVRPAGDR
jgi:hypothetical protein